MPNKHGLFLQIAGPWDSPQVFDCWKERNDTITLDANLVAESILFSIDLWFDICCKF